MKINTYRTPDETAQAITQQLEDQLNSSQTASFHLAISGGYTTEPLFRLWAERYTRRIPWHRIQLYWVDERCVPPTHPESNYGAAKRFFIDQVDIPQNQIHRILGESHPEHEAQRYSELVKKNLPVHDGYPQFDLLLLGMGTDGHTASLFPGQKELLTFPAPYAPSFHPQTGQRRITLTGEPILLARSALFFITGTEKAEMLARILSQDPSAEEYPSGYIARHADWVEFFLDEAAARDLKHEK